MSNTTSDELDTILNDLAQYVHDVASASKHYGVYVGGEPVKEAKTKLKNHFNSLLDTLESELEGLKKVKSTPTVGGINVDRTATTRVDRCNCVGKTACTCFGQPGETITLVGIEDVNKLIKEKRIK